MSATPRSTRTALLIPLALVVVAWLPSPVTAADWPPYIEAQCVAAVVRAPAPSERAALLRRAAEEASKQFSTSLDLYREIEAQETGAHTRAYSQDLLSDLYWLTVRHWLEVKSQLCRCLGYEQVSLPRCESIHEEIEMACDLNPKRGASISSDLFCAKRR